MSEQVGSRTQLKPLFVVKPDSMSRRDILRAEKHAGICIVECAEPESARYMEPPLMANLDEQARAALSLMRMIIAGTTVQFQRGELTKFFVDCLLNGERVKQILPVKPVVK